MGKLETVVVSSVVILLSLAASPSLTATNSTPWIRFYSEVKHYAGWGVTQCSDGGYAVVANSLGEEPLGTLLRTDSEGALLWSHTFTGRLQSVAQCSDGGFILGGEIPSGVNHDAWLIRTDANGNLVRNQSLPYGGSIYCIAACADGGFVFAGAAGGTWLVRANEDGIPIWNRTYPLDQAWSVAECSGGGFVLAAGALLRVNASGSPLWNQTYQAGYCYSVVECASGGFVVGGCSSAYPCTLRTDSNGTLIWNQTYTTAAQGYGGPTIVECSDGGFALAGCADLFTQPVYLLRTNSTGHLTWSFAYNEYHWRLCRSMVRCSNGGFVLAGGIGDPGAWTCPFVIYVPDQEPTGPPTTRGPPPTTPQLIPGFPLPVIMLSLAAAISSTLAMRRHRKPRTKDLPSARKKND